MVLWTNIGASSSNFVLSLLIVIIDLLCFFSFGAQSQVPAGRTRAPVSSRVTADTNRSTRLLSPWNTTISTRRPAEFRRNVSPPQRITLAEEKVCSSIEVNTFIVHLEQLLRNCTVVEGNLKVSLIDYPEKSWDDVSFPQLREITGYVLLYRLAGLKSLRNVFPGLAVIRGRTLFRDNALVIYENQDLEEIGLKSLLTIERGSVYIWKNTVLCYLDTIDWTKVTSVEFSYRNSIMENKDSQQCANQCPPYCRSFFDGKMVRNMCWTSQDCQQGLPPTCGNEPNPPVGCCHGNCLSGCYGPARNECLTCRAVHHVGACMDMCPKFTYKLHNRRCISEEQCRAYSEPFNSKLWKAHDGGCIPECPAKFTVDPVDPHKCNPCAKHSCPKVCSFGGAAMVDTVASAEALAHCTIINGSLEIQVGQGDQVVKTLEEALKNIEEVRDYVKVVRSHALVSLNFLKSLRLIRGEKLATGGYALSVLDNQHLQDLFGFDAARPTMQILNPEGGISFHYNPRLCLNKINAFTLKATNRSIDQFDNRDISQTSNGDRIACDIKQLDLRVSGAMAEMAMIRWDSFELEDPRSLLGYVVSYRESPAQNLTKYEGRDACSGDLWTHMDVDPHRDNVSFVDAVLYDLRPARQYAVYVTTYTIASERQGGQTAIVYFNTTAKQPSKPLTVRTESLNSSSIRVNWRPPMDPNGVIAHYIVRWQKAKDQYSRLGIRNYCISPILLPKNYFVDAITTTTHRPDTCFCNGTDPLEKAPAKSHQAMEGDYAESILMENMIQDTVYWKHRSKRGIGFNGISTDSVPVTGFLDARKIRDAENSTESLAADVAIGDPNENALRDQDSVNTTVASTRSTQEPEMIHQRKVHEGTSLMLMNLHHFTDYIISVEACHKETKDMDYSPCSGAAWANPSQTLAKYGADDIPTSSVVVYLDPSNDTDTKRYVYVSWKDPPHPNGVIVAVDINYQLVDQESNFKPACISRTQVKDTFAKIDFTTMPAGNYSFRLHASTFAGNGSWTEARFIYMEPPVITLQTGVSKQTLAGIIGGVVAAFILLIAVLLYVIRSRMRKVPENPNVVSINPDYYSYKPDEWEVPRENIELGRELGTGTFGKVYEGIAKNIVAGVERMKVAVKTVNEDKSPSERNFFLQEASIMKSFRCHHVVKLLGVVSEGQPALVIMEYMGNADMKSWLRDQRPNEEHPDRVPPLFSRILQMAGEICDGMAYIHSRKFVHRDLAARNCMMDDNLTVKIGDFGMTRDVYETDYYRKGGKGLLPVRWMAPESLKDGLFTNESDVWSFGVVLWEVATLAAQPYQGLANDQVLQFVVDGRLMPRPENCPDRLYHMMKRCWAFQPHNRPTFLQLIEELLPDLNDSFRQLSYFSTVDFNDVSASNRDTFDPSDGHELKDLNNRVISLLRDPDSLNDDDEVTETDQFLAKSPDAAGDSHKKPVPTPSSSLSRFIPDGEVGTERSPLSPPVFEPFVVINQNGGSQNSSTEGGSKGMAMSFPQQDGPRSLGAKVSNGGVNGSIDYPVMKPFR